MRYLCSDLMALGAIRAVRAGGRRVPEDVSWWATTTPPLIAFTDPPLTTVRQSVQAMGAAAVRALIDEDLRGACAPGRSTSFAPSWLVRSSTGSAPPP